MTMSTEPRDGNLSDRGDRGDRGDTGDCGLEDVAVGARVDGVAGVVGLVN